MPISGPDANRQIQRAYAEAQQALQTARQSAQQASGLLEHVSQTQRQTLLDLAKHYLPELSADAVGGVCEQVRQSMRQILLRQQARITELQNQLETREAERQDADERLDEAQRQLDTATERQQTLADQLAEQLGKDEVFGTLAQRAAEAEAALERAESSLEEIEHEALQKLPPFEQSALFMYLHRRGLATPQYTHRGWTRRIDRWVGKLIGYPEAKISYHYLKTMPEQVRQLVAEDRQALDAVMKELTEYRDQAAAQLGLPAAINRVEEATSAQEEALSHLQTIERALDDVRAELTTTVDPNGPFYREALEQLHAFLGQQDRQALTQRAQQTPDVRDDQIVARLEHIDAELRAANTDAVARQQRIQWLDRHLTELGQFQQRFRAANFDSTRSMFEDSLNLEHDLALVRDGRDTIDGVWQRVRHRHRFVASSMEQVTGTLTSAARHPMTQVLVTAMAHAAGDALAAHARRAGQRAERRSMPRPNRQRPAASSPTPARQASPPVTSRKARPGGFYTSRRI